MPVDRDTARAPAVTPQKAAPRPWIPTPGSSPPSRRPGARVRSSAGAQAAHCQCLHWGLTTLLRVPTKSGTVSTVEDMADRKAIPCSVGHPVTGPARRATVLLQLFREQLEKKKQEAPAAALTPAQVPASSARAVRTLAMLAAASKHASWRSAARAQAETPADGGRAAGTEGDASSTGGSAAAESARQICRRRSPK